MTPYQLKTDDFWDLWEPLILENFFVIFITFWKICYIRFERFCSFVIVLQFEESQFYVFNIGNGKTIISYLALKRVLELI